MSRIAGRDAAVPNQVVDGMDPETVGKEKWPHDNQRSEAQPTGFCHFSHHQSAFVQLRFKRHVTAKAKK